MDLPTFNILVGIPGSGKTTLSETIREELSHKSSKAIVRVSSDDFIEAKAKEEGISYQDAFPKYIKEASDNLDYVLDEGLSHKSHIIWDRTSINKKSRRSILRRAPANYWKIAHVLIIDEDLVYERLNKREIETGKSIPFHVVKSMLESYEKPEYNEGFDEIRMYPQFRD